MLCDLNHIVIFVKKVLENLTFANCFTLALKFQLVEIYVNFIPGLDCSGFDAISAIKNSLSTKIFKLVEPFSSGIPCRVDESDSVIKKWGWEIPIYAIMCK